MPFNKAFYLKSPTSGKKSTSILTIAPPKSNFDIKQIVLVGDYANGQDNGKIEIFLIGDDLNMDYISQLELKIEKLIKRKVCFYLASKFLSDQKHITLFNSNNK